MSSGIIKNQKIMAKKTSSKFICQQCSYESVGYMGKCPNCDSWNSFVETVTEESRTPGQKRARGGINAKILKLTDVKASSTKRTSTDISEFDRVLGGGIVLGQVVLIAGDPGIGKSTLLLQLANNLQNILYICGEESVSQVAVRAERL